MPLGLKPFCHTCKTTTSTMWRKGINSEVLCNSCGLKQLNINSSGQISPTSACPVVTGVTGVASNSSGRSSVDLDTQTKLLTQTSSNGNGERDKSKKSSRVKSTKYKSQSSIGSSVKNLPTKGKSQRVIFKKNEPIQSSTRVATVVTSESIFYDGMYYQIGDVVSLMDHDGGIFYAQIRGFMQDQYSEKSAAVTWLLPTQDSPKDCFDPDTYILGPEEDLARKMEYMQFVCHAPSSYFKVPPSRYKRVSAKPETGFIWTRVGAEQPHPPTTDQIFGANETITTDEEIGSKL